MSRPHMITNWRCISQVNLKGAFLFYCKASPFEYTHAWLDYNIPQKKVLPQSFESSGSLNVMANRTEKHINFRSSKVKVTHGKRNVNIWIGRDLSSGRRTRDSRDFFVAIEPTEELRSSKRHAGGTDRSQFYCSRMPKTHTKMVLESFKWYYAYYTVVFAGW